MPRKPVSDYWVAQIRVLVENDPGISGAKIRRKLVNEQKLGKHPSSGRVPSDRSVRRIMGEFNKVQPEDRVRYRFFSWPESVALGALPPQAARDALDLLRYRTEKGQSAPLVRESLWFYWTTTAVPDAPMDIRVAIATHLAMREIWAKPQPHPEVLRLVTYQPWKGGDYLKAYKEAPKLEPKPHRFAMEFTEWTGPFFPELLEGEGSEVIVHFSTGKGKPKGK